MTENEHNKKSPLSRREFIVKTGLATAVTAGLGYMALAPEDFPLSRKDQSGLRSRPEPQLYTLDDFRVRVDADLAQIGVGRNGNAAQVLRKALNAIGGLQAYIKPGDVVLVKPNVAFDRSPQFGATTHPDTLSALIRMLYGECGASEVRVADNPIESPADCFIKSGIRPAVEEAGGRVYLPDGNSFVQLHTPDAKLIKSWSFFQRPFEGVTKVIGLAPVKDHNLSGASLGIKNWYGLLGGKRNQFHQDIHQIISDLSLMIKPTLTILDGTRVLMRNGPTGGILSDVLQKQTIVAGVDPVAVDAWAYTHLLERGSRLPEYLFKAEQNGSGSIDSEGRIKEIV